MAPRFDLQAGPAGGAGAPPSAPGIEEDPMMNMPSTADYELRFRSLFDEGRALAFPCDAKGCVDLDALSPRALHNYLYARTVVGREFCMPAVLPTGLH
jgi:hypothetical protein